MRGPGDIEGTMQSGIAFDLKVANLARDGIVVQATRDEAMAVLDADPALSTPSGMLMARQLQFITRRSVDWSRIS
jgi:ATP-dependent DNA helicase recG